MKVIEQLQILLDINHTNTKPPSRYDDAALSYLEGKALVGINKKEDICYLTPKGNVMLETMKNLITLTED